MIVIASAAYVSYELAAEFGEIPPCMLPLGNRPLLELQVKALRNSFPEEELVLSLPISYKPSVGIAKVISEFDIKQIGVPDELKLAESLLYVINTVGDDYSPLRILHGDTLIDNLPITSDVLAVASTQTDYAWEIESNDRRKEIVWCGYFSFSNYKLFTKCLALARGDFVAAVRSYDLNNQLTRHNTTEWSDLGHINTYFTTRAKITTERDFNLLKIKDGIVKKTSSQHKKINAEIKWYLNVPPKIKIKTPQVIDYGEIEGVPYYQLEYLNLIPLNELYVHGKNSNYFWDRVFTHCDRFLNECNSNKIKIKNEENQIKKDIEKNNIDLLVSKTWSRLEEFARQREIRLDKPWQINDCKTPSLQDIASRCISIAIEQPILSGIMHGDFCFSNILFDSRADGLKVIDPRGISHNGDFTIYGDITYDIAKLMHSVIGLYDFILAGMFSITVKGKESLNFNVLVDQRVIEIQKLFMEKSFINGNIKPIDCISHVILLFISMLPLHNENNVRQLALLANALRLYSIYENKL